MTAEDRFYLARLDALAMNLHLPVGPPEKRDNADLVPGRQVAGAVEEARSGRPRDGIGEPIGDVPRGVRAGRADVSPRDLRAAEE